MKARADQGRFRTAQEVADWVADQWDIRYTAKGIYSLVYRLELRPKVPRPQSEHADPAAQEAWKKGD